MADTIVAGPAAGGPAPRDGGGAGERYVAGGEIARGGMGRVVEASDELLGRTVAMKVVLGEADDDLIARFARETRITALLEHPAIVPVYDAGKLPDGSPFIVMRRVSGQPLEKLVAQTPTIADRLALVPHLVAAASALAFAHARGVLHRDLKPANILVGDFGETFVIDWGLAKIVRHGTSDDDGDDPEAPDSMRPQLELDAVRTRVGSVFGTPGFMSPEQLAGARLDARSDVFALGATLHHVLAQRPPHHDRAPDVMMARAARDPAPPIEDVVEGVPRDLASIVDKALAYDAGDRYPDASSLAADLQAFLAGQLVRARHYTLRERAVRFALRHRVSLLVVTAAAIALAVGAAVAIGRIVDEREAKTEALHEALRDREQAREALDAMTLSRARTLLVTNPTAAIAVARPLAHSPQHWREVRAIGAAARTAGACVGLPGPVKPHQLVVAGSLAGSSDLEGRVWLHDLDRRTSHMIGTYKPDRTNVARYAALQLFFAGDRLMAHDELRVLRFDRSGARSVIEANGTTFAHARATAAKVYVTTSAGTVIAVDLATLAATQLPPTEVVDAAPSPDGRTLAIATRRGLQLAGPDGVVRATVGTGATSELRWSADGELVAATQDGTVVLVAAGPRPAIIAQHDGSPVFAMGVAGGGLYTMTTEAVVLFAPGARPQRLRPAGDPGRGLAFTRGDAYVGASLDGTVNVFGPHLYLTLRSPAESIQRIAASPSSRYVVAAASGRVLVWDLAPLTPVAEHVGAATILRTMANDRVLLSDTGTWRWHDLATRTASRDVVRADPTSMLLSEGTGRTVVLVPAGPRDRVIGIEHGAPPMDLRMPGIERVHLGAGLITIGTRAGEVVDFDTATRRGRIAVTHPSPVIALGARAGWRAVVWNDGTAWRRGPDGREERGRLPDGAGVGDYAHPTDDGRVCIAAARRIACWGAGDTRDDDLTMPLDIWQMMAIDGNRLIVTLSDSSLYRVDLSTRRSVNVLAGSRDIVSVSPDHDLGVTTLTDQRVVVFDLATDLWWSIGRGLTAQAQLVPGGTAVRALAGSKTVLTWPLDLPSDPEGTAAWLDRITNATGVDGPSNVTWPP